MYVVASREAAHTQNNGAYEPHRSTMMCASTVSETSRLTVTVKSLLL